MAWIEVHQNLERHPKMLLLKRATQEQLDTVLGRVLKLWLWALDYAPDGTLSKYDPGMIEEACSIPLKTLIEVGLVDEKPCLRIHDWWDYAGRFLKLKYKNYEEKWRQIEKSYSHPLGRTKSSLRTLTNLSNLSIKPTNEQSDWFQKIWEEYPPKGRVGRKLAFKHFVSSVPDVDTAKRCAEALDKYLDSERVKKGFIQNATTFFNNWTDWENYSDGPTNS